VAALALAVVYSSKNIENILPKWKWPKAMVGTISVQIKPEEGIGLNPVEENRIREIVKGTVLASGEMELEQIAKNLHRGTDFERIHVFKSEPQQFIVSLRKRTPVLAIMADRLRFLTKDGVIYGEVHDNQTPLSMLNGVFSSRASDSFEFGEDGALVTTTAEKVALLEAVELNALANQKNLGVAQIDFQEYRGFILHLTIDSIEVAIGRSPFATRLKRLDSTMNQLKKNGILYSRIELDYDGKAFIKEKKI
jgi:hypothetical protein